MTEIGTIRQVGEKRVSRGHPRPHPNVAGPSVSHIFGTSYMRAHCMRNDNQISHGDQTRCEEKSTTAADARSVCGS